MLTLSPLPWYLTPTECQNTTTCFLLSENQCVAKEVLCTFIMSDYFFFFSTSQSSENILFTFQARFSIQ